jgi:murein DD-endopeptidase MepM/ murein hydrolase activator NlpD
MHRGIDYGGTFDVLSAGDGIVTRVSYNGNKRTGGGHVVIIKHANDLFTAYYHGAHATSLKVGERVQAGQFIYKSGSTGASTGPHLHFETRYSAQWGTTKDPQIFLTGTQPETPTGDNPYKVSLAVNGRENRATWKAWQTALKARWGYTGILDGIPGRLTWSAVQRSVVEHGYKGPIDGIPGPMTRRAVQTKLKKLGLYTMAIDGVWGRGTWSAIQRGLNGGLL